MSRILQQLRDGLIASGLEPGTPAYAKAERKGRVERCKVLNNIDSCWNCGRFDHCELVKAHLRDMYGINNEP